MSPATPELCSEAVDGVTRNIVCLFREPDAGNPPVRFDEREQETEPCQTGLRRRRESFVSSHRETTVTAPVLDSTHLSITDGCTGCDPNRKQSKFECYGLIKKVSLQRSTQLLYDLAP